MVVLMAAYDGPATSVTIRFRHCNCRSHAFRMYLDLAAVNATRFDYESFLVE